MYVRMRIAFSYQYIHGVTQQLLELHDTLPM